MRAAVCHEFGQPLAVEDVEIAPPRPGEVTVRLAATAICHSDIHLLHGEWGGALPMLVGHEGAGVVEEVGEGVTNVAPGDRVVVSLLRSCGRCAPCSSGAPYSCEGVFPIDSDSGRRTRQGVLLQHGGVRAMAFAERTTVDASQVVPVPESMPLDRAALLGCCVVTGTGAVWNTAAVQRGESVVVIGAGGVGLNAIQAARLAGAEPIIAVDRLEPKLEAARAFGATHALNGATMEPKDVVRGVKKIIGRGSDFVFVTVGIPEAVAQAQMMIRAGGTVVVVGMPPVKSTVALRMFDIVWSEQRVIGSRMGSTHLVRDIAHLAALYQRGELKLDELITARYPLEAINDAIASMERGEAVRNVIMFG